MADWWVESFRDVLISVPPQFGAEVGDLTFTAGAVISVPPELIVDGAGASVADVLISVPPEMLVGQPARGSVDLTVAPEVAYAALAHMIRDVTISVPPELLVGGSGHSTAAVTISVPPEVSVAGVGTDGISAVTAGAVASMSAWASGSASFSITAAAGDYVMVDVVTYASTPTSVTCGGVAMTLLKSQSGTGRVNRYGLAGVSGGAKTIAITNAGDYTYAAAVTLQNVVTVGTTASTTAAGNPSQAVSCSAGELIVQSFGDYGTSFGTASGPARIHTYNGGTLNLNLAVSTASATFGDSASISGWIGMATVFKPV